MKKVFSLLLVIFIFSFIGIISIDAAELKFSSNSVSVGKSVTLDIEKIISGNEYSLSFEDGYFDISSNTCGNRTSITSNCKLTLVARTSLSLTENKVIGFTLTEKASNDSTTSSSITINANKTTTKPTEPVATTTKQETKKSNNTNLKTLDVKTSDGGRVELTPTFKSDVYEYSANVSGTVKTISIDATLEDSKATFIVSNNVNDELVAGENNKITITVTAENGTKRTYTINITREALTADATLKELIIDEVEDFELIEDKYNYTIKIAKNVKELSLSYVTSDDNATVEIEGNENLKDGSKVRITVIAEDGTKKVYTLTVSKEKANTKTNTSNIETEKNPLIIMTLSIIAFGLIGGIVYVVKK